MYQKDAIIVGGHTVVVALARSDGRVVLEHPVVRGSDDFHWYGIGGYEVVVGPRRCKGALRTGHLFVACGGKLVHFSQGVLSVLQPDPIRVLGSVPYDRKAHARKPRHRRQRRIEMRVAGVTLRASATTME